MVTIRPGEEVKRQLVLTDIYDLKPGASYTVLKTGDRTMAENIAPPAHKRDDIYAAMQKLLGDAQRVRSAHFIAAQRKSRKSKFIGVFVILLNLLITSGLIEITISNPNKITTAIKLLSFLAAALAGIQTFFNFQKEIECHINAGGVYAGIDHRLSRVVAEYHDKPANRDALITDFKALDAEFLKANDDSKGCVPTDGDLDEAGAGIEERKSHKRAKRGGTAST